MTQTMLQPAQITAAQEHYRRCALCEHRCATDRRAGQLGACKAGTMPRVFRHRVEFGEELELVPSHLFYLSGCDLRCAFCIAGIDAFDPSRGEELTVEYFNHAVAWGQARGARNIEWVGGEPTIHLPHLLAVMAQCRDLPPVIWKSDFHMTPEVFGLLEGVVDTSVADFKFGNDACAQRLAGIPDYLAVITRNLQFAARRAKLIVRHLLMPGHIECCFAPMAEWMKTHLPQIPVSIWEGYLPSWRAAAFPEIAGVLSPTDARRAKELALTARLKVIQ
jgi:putative pyruvate formate lyase activating enzyme